MAARTARMKVVKPMSEKYELVTPGAWVILRAESELRAKHRKRALANRVGALQLDPDTGKPANFEARLALLAQMDAAEDVAAMLIVDWHIPYLDSTVLPDTDPTLIGELTIEDNNRLLELTEPVRQRLLGNPARVDPSDFNDPDSPSQPTSG